jgi:3-isopropylmalate/(R)-2-methylmalate dehydratase small subunit
MESFQLLEASCIPFLKDDMDTDQIIPARFLTATTRTGLGDKLFYDGRYDNTGHLTGQSIFDAPRYRNAQVLVAGHNFGCGSSREHAPWALKEYGFRAIIAVSFADIFYNNALKNALLPVVLPLPTVTQLAHHIESFPDSRVKIDLSAQQVILPWGETVSFSIDGFRKTCLLRGMDDLAYVLSYIPQIQAYEASRQMASR